MVNSELRIVMSSQLRSFELLTVLYSPLTIHYFDLKNLPNTPSGSFTPEVACK